MTSAGDHIVWPAYGAVSAAKAALESYVRQLAVELAPHGISVNALRAGRDRHAGPAQDPRQRGDDRAGPRDAPGRPADDTRRTWPARSWRCAPRAAGWVTGNVIGVDGAEDIAGGR